MNELITEENHFAFITRTWKAIVDKSNLVLEDPRDKVLKYGHNAYCYRNEWKAAGIKFKYGVLLYLFSFQNQFKDEIISSKGTWVIDFWNNNPKLQELIIDADMKETKNA